MFEQAENAFQPAMSRKISPIDKLRPSAASLQLNERTSVLYIPMSYKNARRKANPIYNTLMCELYEENCLATAKYFWFLVEKEMELKRNNNIRSYLKDNEKFLVSLHQQAIAAEHASQLDDDDAHGMATCFQLLQQIIQALLEHQHYEWLLDYVFEIVTGYCERQTDLSDYRTSQLKANIYCMYGLFLSKKNVAKSSHFLSYSLEICRSEAWPVDEIIRDSSPYANMHEFAAVSLTRSLIAYAKSVAHSNPTLGVELAAKATVAISEVKSQFHSELLCEAYLLQSQLLIEINDFKKAMNILNQVKRYLTKDAVQNFGILSCEFYLLKGKCLKEFNEVNKAHTKFKQALLVSRKYKLTHHEAIVLFTFGKFLLTLPNGVNKGKYALEESRCLFLATNDEHRRKSAHYALAKIQVDKLLPELFQRVGKINDRLNMMELRAWKNRLKPFWYDKPMRTLSIYSSHHYSDLSDLSDDESTLSDISGESA